MRLRFRIGCTSGLFAFGSFFCAGVKNDGRWICRPDFVCVALGAASSELEPSPFKSALSSCLLARLRFLPGFAPPLPRRVAFFCRLVVEEVEALDVDGVVVAAGVGKRVAFGCIGFGVTTFSTPSVIPSWTLGPIS